MSDKQWRGAIGVGRSRSTRRKPTCPSGRPRYAITYNHCRSRGSNSGRSGDKQVHCPLRYLDKNNWNQPLNFQSSSERPAIYQVVSTLHNFYEDRRFDFNCRQVPSVSGSINCKWSGYVNEYDANVLHTCSNGGYLNGVHSIHNNKKEDRRYKFRCCTPRSGFYHKNCKWTGWENKYDKTLNYFAPTAYVIKGVNSIHNNKKEDRIFRFEICKVARIK
ncbi:hemagglutinin/amebocyte aggregation factor-like [Magallana gigas]|uniref:hemagglutinin/amebocyte aggregation factor-like n=1 Tax=Magallana gigas TaxID=29159 RepID=UPI00333ED510